MTDHAQRPSLRIAEFAITGFRTFRERTIIPLSTGDRADPLVVFHGDNGAGKSNALAALDLFFRAVDFWTSWRSGVEASILPDVRTAWEKTEAGGFLPSRRDLPPGYREAVAVEVRFADSGLGAFRMAMKQAGPEVYTVVGLSRNVEKTLQDTASTDYGPLSPDESRYLRNVLLEPLGPGSRPFFLLDEHRRGPWAREEAGADSLDTLSPRLAERLLALRQSLEPAERQRWKAFLALLEEFPTLKGKEVSIDRLDREAPAELTFEVPGEQVLRLKELSSGEQQVVTLCAALLTARSSIVAVAEPEMSLSVPSQKLLRMALEKQIEKGSVDQILLESHSPRFDGPQVVRFERTEKGTSGVSRVASSAEDSTRSTRAKAAGAEQEWVTAEGFTELPSEMRRELGVERGGRIWFLKDENERWAAWTTEELDQMFGFSSGEG